MYVWILFATLREDAYQFFLLVQLHTETEAAVCLSEMELLQLAHGTDTMLRLTDGIGILNFIQGSRWREWKPGGAGSGC